MPKHPSVFRNIYYGSYQPFDGQYNLFKSTKDSLDFVQRLSLWKKLEVHNGCVNTICWSESGEVLLSGSDDQHLCITNGYTYETVANLETAHRANIFSAKFLPNSGDRLIVSCSGDGLIIYTELDRPEVRTKNTFNCHRGTVYKVVTIPNEPNSFMSCGEDGTVRLFDLRLKNGCSKADCKEDVLLSYPKSITALAVDQVFPYQFAIGCCDSSVGIYDRRMMGTRLMESHNETIYQGLITKFSVPGFEGKSHRITSLAYSSDCQELLVSYSSENLFLFNMKSFHNGSEPKLHAVYHTQSNGDMAPFKVKSPSAPPMKRLRLRGDWSDTGPNARPNVERGESSDDGQSRLSFHAHLMRHVSTVLTRMLNDQPEQADQVEADDVQNDAVAGPNRQDIIRTADPETTSAEPTENESAPATNDQLSASGPHSPMATGESETAANIPDDGTAVAVSSSRPSGSTFYNRGVPNMTNGVIDLPALDSSDMDESEDGEELLASLVGASGAAGFHIELPVVLGTPMDCSSPVAVDVGHATNELNNTRTTSQSMELCSYLESDANASATRGPSQFDVTPDNPVSTDICLPGAETTESECQLEKANVKIVKSTEEGASTSSVAAREFTAPTAQIYGTSDDDSESEEAIISSGERRRQSLKKVHAQLTSSEEPSVDQEREEENLEKAFIRGLPQPVLRQKYAGHRNARTMIKEANFWGSDYVISGSDCGHVFIWNRHTADLVMILEADRHVVNCVQPHPFDPVLATSGIDYDVKLWSPCAMQPNFDAARAAELTSRNEVMLEETRDTITVPASFMIRMLASFNHLRQNSPIARWRQSLQANRSRARED